MSTVVLAVSGQAKSQVTLSLHGRCPFIGGINIHIHISDGLQICSVITGCVVPVMSGRAKSQITLSLHGRCPFIGGINIHIYISDGLQICSAITGCPLLADVVHSRDYYTSKLTHLNSICFIQFSINSHTFCLE